MSTDCHVLQSSAALINETNDTTLYEIWLDREYNHDILSSSEIHWRNKLFWQSWIPWIGIITITIMSFLIIACYRQSLLKYYLKRKKSKLKDLNIELTVRDEAYDIIYPYFNDGEDHIIDLILDYANIILKRNCETQINKYVPKNAPKNTSLKPRIVLSWSRFCCYCTTTSIVFGAIWIVALPGFIHTDHWYKDYAKPQCNLMDLSIFKNHSYSALDSYWLVNMTDICDPQSLDIDAYDVKTEAMESDDEDYSCYLNLKDMSVAIADTGQELWFIIFVIVIVLMFILSIIWAECRRRQSLVDNYRVDAKIGEENVEEMVELVN